MREGQRVCHILTQNMGDTTKVQQTQAVGCSSPSFPVSVGIVFIVFIPSQAFEELLRANDIDYYMGQSFREQLAQNIALAQRVVTKISGRKDQHCMLTSCPLERLHLTFLPFPQTCLSFYSNRRLRRESQ